MEKLDKTINVTDGAEITVSITHDEIIDYITQLSIEDKAYFLKKLMDKVVSDASIDVNIKNSGQDFIKKLIYGITK